MLFSRSAFLPRSLRRIVKILKSIHGTHGKIMKNRIDQIISNPFIPALHNIILTPITTCFLRIVYVIAQPDAKLPTHPHPRFLEMTPVVPKVKYTRSKFWEPLIPSHSSECEPSFQGFKPQCGFQPRSFPKPSETKTLWKPAVVRNEKPWFQDWHAWAPTFRNPQFFEIRTRTVNFY